MLKSMLIVLIILACSTAACTSQVQRPTQNRPSQVTATGMNILVYSNDGDTSAFAEKYEKVIKRLKTDGIVSVTLAFPIFQDKATSTKIYPEPQLTPSRDKMARFIGIAHANDMPVTLLPLMESKDGAWRGDLRPDNQKLWFASYIESITTYAKFAQSNGVETLSIGTEMRSLEPNKTDWESVIAVARQNYAGRIIYSANWDSYETVPFWDKTDAIGINAYFPLATANDASVSQMADAWHPWISKLYSFQQQHKGKPIELSEIGVVSQTGAQQEPWNWQRNAPVNQTTQQRYYQAALQTFCGAVPKITWWAVDLNAANSQDEAGYTPLNKTAEHYLVCSK